MKKSLFLGTFFCLAFAQTAFAQVTVQLSEGKTFVIKGKEINEDKYYGKCYLDETPDTIHFYAHKIYEAGRFTLTHTRIPTRYFSKAESKISGAHVKFLDKKKFANTSDIVSFKCAKSGSNMLTTDTKNEFLETTYSNTGQPKEVKNCLASVYFKDQKEAKAFAERMKALSKK
jgi:hypothetical protein